MRDACLASLLLVLPALALADAPPVPTGNPQAVDASVPKRYRIEVGNAQVLGDILAKEDIAAWVATDAMLESGSNKLVHGKPTGWLTRAPDPTGLKWVVSFTAKDGDREYSFADVSVLLDGKQPRLGVSAPAGGRDLEPEEKLFLHARDLTMARTDWLHCAETYNYSVGWAEMLDGRRILVRLLPARKDANVFPFGGFHEFSWATKEGGEVKHFSQTRGCLDMPAPPANADGFFVTHLTSDTPTQFHVFQSLSYQHPVYVATESNGLTWKVEDGHISVVDLKYKPEGASPPPEAK
jgi:hypothetical protein